MRALKTSVPTQALRIESWSKGLRLDATVLVATSKAYCARPRHQESLFEIAPKKDGYVFGKVATDLKGSLLLEKIYSVQDL